MPPDPPVPIEVKLKEMLSISIVVLLSYFNSTPISSPADKLSNLVMANAPEDHVELKLRETSVSVSTTPFLLNAAVIIRLAL